MRLRSPHLRSAPLPLRQADLAPLLHCLRPNDRPLPTSPVHSVPVWPVLDAEAASRRISCCPETLWERLALRGSPQGALGFGEVAAILSPGPAAVLSCVGTPLRDWSTPFLDSLSPGLEHWSGSAVPSLRRLRGV